MATKKKAPVTAARTRSRSASAVPAPWKRKNPKPSGERTALSPEAKAAAKRRAREAGRRYPNLIDNMWAAAEFKK